VQINQRVRWDVVSLLMALCFISHFNRISMSVAGDERIMQQYGIAPDKMGMVYSAFLFVYTMFMIPGGFFIDRFGPRAALALVGFGSAMFCMLTGLVGFSGYEAAVVWAALLLVRGAMGLVTTPLHPGAATAVGLWVPEGKRRLVNGLVTGAALLGVASTYTAFAFLIGRLDWPRAFVITGAATAVITIVWLSVAPVSRPAASDRASFEGWQKLLRNRKVLLLTLSYAAIGYFQYLFFYWMHYYFRDILHFGEQASRYYASIPTLTMALCMPLGGWLADKFRSKRTLIPLYGMAFGGLLLIVSLFPKTPFSVLLFLSLALGAVGAAEGAFWSTIVEVGGGFGGTAAAIMNTGGNGGGMLAPYVTPLVSKAFGWPIGIALGGIICLAGALCWIGIKPRENEFQTGHDPNAG
jgi:ACS family D-galactonate transporter-like MFS transporter